MGPDRFRRIPSAKEFKKIRQHILLASAILVSSASSSDAQSTPRTEPLSNSFVEKQLTISPQEFDFGIHSFDQASVKLSDLVNNPYEVDVAEIPNVVEDRSTNDNESSKSSMDDKSVSLITGYYCKYIPGYIIGDGGGYCGLTAMGIPVERGIAACGSNYQLGVYIEVEGFGKLLCADRGYLLRNQIDIFFETNELLEKSQKPDFAKVRTIENP